MDRTSASYKLNYGVKKTIQDEVLEEIRSVPFSLNIDEATSKTYKRILGVHVSYWSEKLQRTVVQHLAALEVVSVTAESLFKKLDNLFEKMSLPCDNLISILMDSCAVMRGSKNGLEKLIRDRRAPQIIDIDGDSCHHVHNASKKFCSPFEHWVEGLLSDLHTDHRWSADMRDGLREISIILGIHASRSERYIPHRWLSVLDVSLDTLRMWDAFVILSHPGVGYYLAKPRPFSTSTSRRQQCGHRGAVNWDLVYSHLVAGYDPRQQLRHRGTVNYAGFVLTSSLATAHGSS
ncbi:uncharacterized protein [Paramisgurnus dabryanus]|uniref:uncharacterized protein n=1 Tax=Paramisgurnus dabryanus TaxID=90735 RepID=UPI003CCF31C0